MHRRALVLLCFVGNCLLATAAQAQSYPDTSQPYPAMSQPYPDTSQPQYQLANQPPRAQPEVIQSLPPIEPEPAEPEAAEPVEAPPAEDEAAEIEDGAFDLPIAEAVPQRQMSWLERECCLWDGNFEVGINGSAGNNDSVNFRTGMNLKRDSKRTTLSLDLLYRRNNEEGELTANRLYGEGRNEWHFDKSPWTGYAHGLVEFDEFTAYDSRTSVDMGWGYKLWDTDSTTFIGRFGSGVSREWGGPEEKVTPEGVVGMELNHEFSERQKFTIISTYYPDWTMFDEYRLNTKADWQIVLDKAANLSFKLGVISRYDSTPNGADPNDLDYYLALLWSF